MPTRQRLATAPTMLDVAREAGVSKALVSIVFRNAPGASPENRERVFAVAERLGYRTNRTASLLALQRTRQLGVVLDLHNSFHAEVADATLAAADALGYRVVVNPWTAALPEESAIATALEFRCEALLLVGSELPADTIASLAGTTPVVSIGRSLDLDGADVVRCADDVGMQQLVDHLIALGHTRIGHVDGGHGTVATARRTGFAQALRHHGYLDDTLIVEGGRTADDGRRAATHLLALPQPPTAITAFNDHCALGVIDACQTTGVHIPDDIAVTGYDDTPLAQLHTVSLTSVGQEAPHLARWAVNAALERLDQGRTRARESVLAPRIIIRRSTAVSVAGTNGN